MFLILVRNISCPQQMFPSLRNMEQHGNNNVSATMCPRLPVPLGKVSGTDIGAYVSYLKNDYAEQERQRKFKEAEYIGFQEGSYWLLSSEVIEKSRTPIFD